MTLYRKAKGWRHTDPDRQRETLRRLEAAAAADLDYRTAKLYADMAYWRRVREMREVRCNEAAGARTHGG
jgi:hypothetical protein